MAIRVRNGRFANGRTGAPTVEREADNPMPSWIGPWRVWRRDIAAATLVGLFLGAVGPFGSFLNGDTGLRLAYWAAMSLLALATYGIGLRWALHEGRKRNQPEWFILGAGIAILSAPYSLAVSVCATTLWPVTADYVRPMDWYWQCLLLGIPISFAWYWLSQRSQASRLAIGQAPPATAIDRFDQSLIASSGERIICLQMEDHYVRIHTPSGSRLVLSPLREAIDGLAQIEGLQVHRSWWVARDEVVRPLWIGRNLRLELTNGVRAPVSRSSVTKLRAMGWLPVE